jgi:hypothetical protein
MLNKIAAFLIAALLAWGLEQVVVSPLDTGAIYPQYSTLRSDPMGAMALYESLGKVVPVERLYKSRVQENRGTTIFVLGVDPVAWSTVDLATLKEYEELTSKGARLVIGFLPFPKSWSKEQTLVEQRWHLQFRYGLMPGPEWKRQGDSIERPMGAGSVVLVDDSYPLSNEGLREQHDAAMIAGLVGPANKVVFDENHFGVVETGSVTKLMRKYHLEGAVFVLALVAALFLWRSSSSLLPSRAPSAEQAVSGRDSLEGMTALLRRGIPEPDLVRVCYEEWCKTQRSNLKMTKDIESHFHDKNAVSAYKALMEKL